MTTPIKEIFNRIKIYQKCWSYAAQMLSMHKKDATVPDLFTELTNKQPWTLFHQDNDSTWTYKELNAYSNQVANIFNTRYSKGDVVLLYAPHCPECTGIWLAFAKLGIVTALCNTNILNIQLAERIQQTNPKAIICTNNVYQNIKAIRNLLAPYPDIFLLKDHNVETQNIEELISLSSKDPPILYHKPGFYDRLLLLYDNESRPGIINNYRYIQMALMVQQFHGMSSEALATVHKWGHLSDTVYELLTKNKRIVEYNGLGCLESILPKLFNSLTYTSEPETPKQQLLESGNVK